MARRGSDPRIRNRIPEQRRRLGLNKAALARALDVYPNVITELENGDSYASERTLADMCELFCCQPGDIYYKVSKEEAEKLGAKNSLSNAVK